MRNNSNNLFSVNMKNVSKNKEYNVTLDVVVILFLIFLFLFYISLLTNIMHDIDYFYRTENQLQKERTRKNMKTLKLLLIIIVSIIVALVSKYSIGLGLLTGLLLILCFIFKKDLVNSWIKLVGGKKQYEYNNINNSIDNN